MMPFIWWLLGSAAVMGALALAAAVLVRPFGVKPRARDEEEGGDDGDKLTWNKIQGYVGVPAAFLTLLFGWWLVSRGSSAPWSFGAAIRTPQFLAGLFLFIVLITTYLLAVHKDFEKRFSRRLLITIAVVLGPLLIAWATIPQARVLWANRTNPTLLPPGDFPKSLEPRFVASDCQREPPDAIAMRVDTTSLILPSRVVRNPNQYWDVLWTGNESAGFAILTDNLKRELLVLYPNARRFRGRLEVFGGPLNHFDQRNVEFQRRPDGPWVHETVPLDFERSYDRNTGYWYCQNVPTGGYPNPQLTPLMGPVQSAFVLGSITNPAALRTFDEIVRDHRGVVEFDFGLDEEAYLYFMHWDHRYIGWFGHQTRFKLFVEPAL